MHFDSHYVRNMLNISLLLLSFSTLASSLHTAINPPINCANSNATWDISQSTLYNQAFAWTHKNEIGDWSYNTDTLDVSGMFDECVRVQYRTKIKIPRFFFAYNKLTDQEVLIDKLVCVKNSGSNKASNMKTSSALEEKITLHNVPFVHSIDILITGHMADQKISLDANIDISIPWYLEILRFDINKHVSHSLDEYLRLLVNDICKTKLRQLKKPPQVHLHVKPTRRRIEHYTTS